MPKTLNLLTAPWSASDGLVREGAVWRAMRPWAEATLGPVRLAAGWWRLVFEGDADSAELEVHLRCPREPQISLCAHSAGLERLYLASALEREIVLQFGPWPGERVLQTLKLESVPMTQIAAGLARSAVRILGAKGALQRVGTVARELAFGGSVGFGGHSRRGAAHERGARAEQPNLLQSEPRVCRGASITAYVHAADTLHPQWEMLASQAFKDNPNWAWIVADRIVDGRVEPKPQWDDLLAAYADAWGLPAFAQAVDGEPLLASAIFERMREAGANRIGRLALPLVSGTPIANSLAPIPPPTLLTKPSVSIVIPTKYRMDLLRKVLAGLVEQTDYTPLEVIVVDNGANDATFAQIIATARQHLSVQLVKDLRPFNFSELVNRGVACASGDLVVIVNDDIEAIQPSWLLRMAAAMADESVGVVGPRLLYPDGALQHAGIVLGPSGVCCHQHRGISLEHSANNALIMVPGVRSAVTGACLMSRRLDWREIGGFDPCFPVAFNDVDFCLRMRAHGLKTVYRGDAVLVHHESQSRGMDAGDARRRDRLAAERERFAQRWPNAWRSDPVASPAMDWRFDDARATRPALVWT